MPFPRLQRFLVAELSRNCNMVYENHLSVFTTEIFKQTHICVSRGVVCPSCSKRAKDKSSFNGHF